MKKILLLLSILLLPLGTVRIAHAAPSGLDLFREGKPEQAKAAFLASVEKAAAAARENKTPADKTAQWQALMALAWFLDETGEHREAIRYSNQALDIAGGLNDAFLIGRSLAWLGWAYSSLGLYDTAVQFYTDALRYGSPNGTPLIPLVWGISKQELGYLYFKMGDLKTAKTFLQETTDFARQNGILIGVAEGGVRLAEIAIQEGNLGLATTFATEALQAAEKCNCTPFTLVHAKITLANIALEKSKLDSSVLPNARQTIDDAYQSAKKLGIRRFIAEGQLLQAKLIPAQEFEKRYNLTREGFEQLETMESERRGDAELAVGKVFLEDANTSLAKFYLEHGVKVNETMLRSVHKSRSTQDLAHLDGMLGDRQAVLNKLQKAVDEALSSGSKPAALEAEEQLFRELSQLGYNSLAVKWGKEALKLYDSLIAEEQDAHLRGVLERRRLAAIEEMFGDALEVAPLAGNLAQVN